MLRACCLFALIALTIVIGCARRSEPPVTLYSALDREFAEPLLDRFSEESGARVLAKYDDESTKTVGLTSALIQEAGRPRCDVFWNNEILNTVRLEEKGLLQMYQSPAATAYPEMYQSASGAWHGFAARARVLIANTRLINAAERPTSIYDLAAITWKGKVGMARPIAGTTATHVACLFAVLGDDEAKAFMRRLKANEIRVLGGNKQVAQAVASGQIAFGLTDTDDAIIEVERASPVTIVYPDREVHQLGTLFIPNTVAIMKGCPHAEPARRLVDFLLSPASEEMLARGPSAQIPLNPTVQPPRGVETPKTVKSMPVDFAAAAKKWDAAVNFLEQEFLKE